MKRHGDRYREMYPWVSSKDAGSKVQHDFSTRGRRPHAVTMGICLVMVRVMRVCGFTLVVMVHVRMCRITVGMRGSKMRQKRKRPLSPRPMVNQHVRRSVEKGKNDAEG